MASKNTLPREVTNTANLYNNAYDLYKEIQDQFEDIQENELTYENDKFKFRQLEKDVKTLKSMASKIRPSLLSGYESEEAIDNIEKNIDYFIEDAIYIEKRLMASKYFKPLLKSVKNYIDNLIGMEKYDYKTYAEDFDQLAKKFTGVLLHPDNIELFGNHIKRMIVGTMSDREFKKIYAANKHKMSKLRKYNFESFKEYKRNYEA